MARPCRQELDKPSLQILQYKVTGLLTLGTVSKYLQNCLKSLSWGVQEAITRYIHLSLKEIKEVFIFTFSTLLYKVCEILPRFCSLAHAYSRINQVCSLLYIGIWGWGCGGLFHRRIFNFPNSAFVGSADTKTLFSRLEAGRMSCSHFYTLKGEATWEWAYTKELEPGTGRKKQGHDGFTWVTGSIRAWLPLDFVIL